MLGYEGIVYALVPCVSLSQLGMVEENMKQWRKEFNSIV